jgi:hypothetical protein
MLNLAGRGSAFCDGMTRRSMLQAGALALGGISLADVLRARSRASEASRPGNPTSVIFIELAGGPSHLDTYDPKPLAPVEFRGPLEAIATNIPGFSFSQYMSEQAKIADRLTVLRSIHHRSNSHDPSSHLTQTGYYKRGMKGGSNEMPSLGAVAAHFRGSDNPAVPPYVALPTVMRNGRAAQLGPACDPFETIGDPSRPGFKVRNLALTKGLSAGRLNDRSALLASLDARRELVDLHGSADAIDDFTRQAIDLVTGSAARQAFDIGREKNRTRDAYGRNGTGQNLLLARRLVEAGVVCVSVRVTGWDDHVNIAKRFQARAPNYDRGLAALVKDLYERGLEKSVLVIAMGEFGRTPRVNKNAGRDHWGAAMSVLLAGGGLKPGVFGATNAKGEVPVGAAYRPENVLATAYRHLGIDTAQTFSDFSGRPRYILEEREIIDEIA